MRDWEGLGTSDVGSGEASPSFHRSLREYHLLMSASNQVELESLLEESLLKLMNV